MAKAAPTSLDALPIELVRVLFDHLGDVEQPHHARLVAPLSLVAKRYVGPARARMMASVTLVDRRGLRAFIAMLEAECAGGLAVGQLSVTTWQEPLARRWAAEAAAMWASSDDEEEDGAQVYQRSSRA